MAPTLSGEISGNCLLVSSTSENTDLLRRTMQQFAIAGEACDDPEVALRLIRSRKYEAFVIDFQLGGVARNILHEVRNSPSNRRSVVFALVNEDTEANEAFISGSSFTLSKPVEEEKAVRLLRAAYGMILRERRRYFRCPITTPVIVVRKGVSPQSGQMLNLSEGGLAVVTEHPPSAGECVFVQFTLPGSDMELQCHALGRWSNPAGHAGMQILSMDAPMKAEMDQWLARRLDEYIPAAVTSQLETPAKRIQ